MKLRLILLALSAASALAACGGNEPAQSNASDAAPAHSEVQPTAQSAAQPAAQPAQAQSQPAAQPAAPQTEHDGAPMAAEPKSESEKQSD